MANGIILGVFQNFQELVQQVPEFVHPLILAAAGAVPFIEGEGATTIGVLGGINPLAAALAGFAGNLLCVVLLVLLGSGTRGAVVGHRGRRERSRREGLSEAELTAEDAERAGVTLSPRRAKFQRVFSRWGVPGVSLLGPALLPTQFTATMLAGAGVAPRRIIFWQAIAIAGWTSIAALLISYILSTVQ